MYNLLQFKRRKTKPNLQLLSKSCAISTWWASLRSNGWTKRYKTYRLKTRLIFKKGSKSIAALSNSIARSFTGLKKKARYTSILLSWKYRSLNRSRLSANNRQRLSFAPKTCSTWTSSNSSKRSWNRLTRHTSQSIMTLQVHWKVKRFQT